ncbi:MAG: beta-ketoacyl-[acyl-carrier-protein] synthase family protein [Planctomycetota bacterium]
MATGESRAKVVVTGMGLATSLGLNVAATWESIRAGRIGLGPMDHMESTLPEGSIGGQAMELPQGYAPGLPREVRYLRWVIEQAMAQAGVEAGGTSHEPGRRAMILGTTLHGLRAGGRFLRTGDVGELRHFLAGAVTRLAIQGLGIQGLSATTCSACSSSLGAVALGVTMLETGQADVVIAGGYDAVSEYAWAGFNALRLVAPDAVRPFAKERRGMMPAEGYGVLVLERAHDASRRGVAALAVVEGWGESADAHHLTQPDPKGSGAARAMRIAMTRAGVRPADISMIAAHATATLDNDAGEYAAFSEVFGDTLAATPVVGFKSHLGHTLGGAGGVELILSVCSLSDGLVPACATVRQEDVEFADLRVAPAGGLRKQITRTLNTSLGFGGANTCLILGRCDQAREAPPIVLAPGPDREAWITGYGVVLPGISGVNELLERLGSVDGVVVPRGEAARVTDEQLATILNVRRVRRVSTCVKAMLASVALAIRHAGLEGDADRLGLACAMLASTHGSPAFCAEYYAQIVREGVLAANPVLFAEGVPNAGAAHVSTTFGIRGACQTIIGTRTAGLDALGLAAMRVWSGASDTIIVGAAEETHACVDRAYEHFHPPGGSSGAPGFFSTPGSVALVVESSASARARGARAIARIERYAGASPTEVVADGALCFGDIEGASRVLNQLECRSAVLGSANATWIDRAEALAVRRSPGASLVESLHGRVGDLFAPGPLLAIVRAIAGGSLGRMTALCTDFTGTAAAVELDRLE